MALPQHHLADEKSTLLMPGAKVSGPITGFKLSLEEADEATDPTPSHVLSDTLTASPLMAPFFYYSHSNYTKIIPLTKPSIQCKFTLSIFVMLSRILSLSSSCYYRCCQPVHIVYDFYRLYSVLVNLSQEVLSQASKDADELKFSSRSAFFKTRTKLIYISL